MKYVDLIPLRDNTIRDFLMDNLPMTDDQRQAFAQIFDQAIEVANHDIEMTLQNLFAKQMLRRKHFVEELDLIVDKLI